MKIRIKTDVYRISERIKLIDRDYVIMFDTDRGQYEIHNLSQSGSTFCLSIPYPYLDERVLKLTRQTMSKNIDTILAKMDNDNTLRESEEKHRTLSFLRDVIADGR